MEKNYQIKVYEYDWTFKRTISPSLILSSIYFDSQMNGGQWQFKLKLNLPISNTRFAMSDFIKITCFDDDHIAWRLIYTWYISRIERNLSSDGEYIEMVCLWLYSFMSRLFFKSWSDYVFNKNQDVWTTIGDVIDYFNSVYTANRISKTNVATYWTVVSIDFSYKKCIDALKDMQKITSDFYFYVWPDGNVTYKARLTAETNHRLKVENHIEEIQIEEQVENVVNTLFVQYGVDVGWPYEDATSKTTYGNIEGYQRPSGITDVAGAWVFGNQYIADNKDEKKQIVVTVNNKYDLESIKPWHTVTLLNTEYQISNLEIQKVAYYFDRAVLFLNKYETFAETILSDNE